MPDNNSIGDFVRDALKDHDAGASSADEATLVTGMPLKTTKLGALPGHEVESLIARGGMGAVYLARQHALEREVAVKVMTAEAGSPEMAARFRREALVLGKLAHPNIVPVYDIGTDDEGQLFYTMKLVKGRTLQHILNDLGEQNAETLRAHTLASLLTVFRKVCDAMAFAHSQGVIHRDLKPENVMVGEFGEVLVMDWGLAKWRNDECRMTNDEASRSDSPHSSFDIPHSSFTAPVGANSLHTLQGAVLGTPQYMSPEQARGEIDALDERSDIFSLGGILYAILTLHPPVEGTTVNEVLEKVRTGSITPPTAFQTSSSAKGRAVKKGEVLEARLIRPLPHIAGGRVPAALSAVAMKALRAEKSRRYQSVAEFSADVEAFQGGFATSAEQAGAWRQIVLLTMRHKAVAASLAVLLLVSIGFVLKVMASERKATRNAEVAVENEKAARRALAKSALSLAEAALREGNGVAMRAALNDVPEDLRDGNWRYLFGQADSSIARIDLGGGTIWDVAAHPRLPHVFVMADSRPRVTLFHVLSGERLLEFTPDFDAKNSGGWDYCVAISPDGERIAVGRRWEVGNIAIHDARDGKKVGGWPANTSSLLAYSPDGKLLLQLEALTHRACLWDAGTGARRWEFDGRHLQRTGAFTPDSTQVLLQDRGMRSTLINVADGNAREIGDSGDRAALRSDGKLIALADRRGVIRVVQFADRSRLFEQRTDDASIEQLCFSDDGERLVSVAVLADGRQSIRVCDANTGSQLYSLLGGSGDARGAAVHPISGELVVCGQETRAWNLGGARWRMGSGGAQAALAFWGADDLVLAPASGGIAALVKLTDSKPVKLWAYKTPNYRIPSVSADGRFAAIGWESKPDAPFIVVKRDGEKVEEVLSMMPAAMPYRLRLSPSGSRLAIVCSFKDMIDLVDVASGTRPVTLARRGDSKPLDCAWLGEDRLLALVAFGAKRGRRDPVPQIEVWDTTTGKLIQTETNSSAMTCITVAPDRRHFAESGTDKNVRIRDAATLAVVREFRVHDGPVTALAWHPSRPIIATASTDLSIRLWDVETGRKLLELRGPLAAPHTLDFSPSGKRLGCAAIDGHTRIWELENDE